MLGTVELVDVGSMPTCLRAFCSETAVATSTGLLLRTAMVVLKPDSLPQALRAALAFSRSGLPSFFRTSNGSYLASEP